MTPRLPSRPLALLLGFALLAPVAASAANPTPAPLAAPSSPNPVSATSTHTATPPAAPTTTTTRTSTASAHTYTPPAKVTPTGPTAAQRAAALSAKRKATARKAAALRRHRHQLQILAAAQTHSEAVLRAQLVAAKRTNAVDLLAGSVARSIGAVPAGKLEAAAATVVAAGSGGSSFPLPALMLGACAALLGIGAVVASRRGIGLVTAALSLLVLVLAGI